MRRAAQSSSAHRLNEGFPRGLAPALRGLGGPI